MALPPKPDPEHPIVETPPGGTNLELSIKALNQRIRQQEILADLGVSALKGVAFQQLLQSAVRFAAEGLGAEMCKVLEYQPGENRLLMVAGVGWDAGLVGKATVGADFESPSGFALKTGKPVISNHLEQEERFRTPDLLRAHQVRRAINVILQGDGTPYGVLEVDSRSPGEFSEHDIAFLQGTANILGMAIERQRFERNLRQALEHQQVLLGEINHRVKNSLQLVASMLSLQATGADDARLSNNLQLAVGRVTAVARIHERLYRSPEIGTVDLGAYLGDVSADLAALAPNIEITYKSEHHCSMAADRAVRVALLATELVMNAAKHGYPSGGRGDIAITLSASSTPNSILLVVKDDGIGLPSDFDITRPTGLGMRIVRALVDQMGATLDMDRSHVGAEFRITVPLQPV